jgi:hypothetical protein
MFRMKEQVELYEQQIEVLKKEKVEHVEKTPSSSQPSVPTDPS